MSLRRLWFDIVRGDGESYRWWTVYPFWMGDRFGLKLGPVTLWGHWWGIGLSWLGRYGWEWSRLFGWRVWRLHA